MSKKRDFSNVKKDNSSKDARISARKSADQARKKKQLQHILIGGAVALVVIVAITLALLAYYGDNIVARINGIPIRASELAPHRDTAERQLQERNASFWTEDWHRDIREEMVRVVALPTIIADFGRNIGVDVDNYDFTSAMVSSVTTAIIDDPALFADFEEFMLVGPTEADVEMEYFEAETAAMAAEIKAELIMERALAGEDFAELMFTYSEDFGGVERFPNGYTFTAEQMVEEFSIGTMELEIGEISRPIRSEFGFHVIMRIEPDPNDMMTPVDVPEELLLGAMHILIAAENIPLETRLNRHRQAEDGRRRQAVTVGFQARLEEADLVFRSALNRVDV